MTEAQRKVMDILWEIKWRLDAIDLIVCEAPRSEFSHVFDVSIGDMDTCVKRWIREFGSL